MQPTQIPSRNKQQVLSAIGVPKNDTLEFIIETGDLEPSSPKLSAIIWIG